MIVIFKRRCRWRNKSQRIIKYKILSIERKHTAEQGGYFYFKPPWKKTLIYGTAGNSTRPFTYLFIIDPIRISVFFGIYGKHLDCFGLLWSVLFNLFYIINEWRRNWKVLLGVWFCSAVCYRDGQIVIVRPDHCNAWQSGIIATVYVFTA